MWVKILIENAVVLLLVHFVINFIYLFIWIDWIELFYECGLFIWSFLSTASDFGLFLADDDAKKGVWLEAGRSLEYYLLRNGVCMQYAAAHITFDHSSSGFLYCCFNGNFYLSVTMNYLVDIVFLQQFTFYTRILSSWPLQQHYRLVKFRVLHIENLAIKWFLCMSQKHNEVRVCIKSMQMFWYSANHSDVLHIKLICLLLSIFAKYSFLSRLFQYSVNHYKVLKIWHLTSGMLFLHWA